jgi:hypothetical protein
MNNTKNKHEKQDQINHLENQQQKTRHEHGPQKQGQNANRLPQDPKPNYQEHEHPEARLTR